MKINFGYHKHGFCWRFRPSFTKYWGGKIWTFCFWRFFMDILYRWPYALFVFLVILPLDVSFFVQGDVTKGYILFAMQVPWAICFVMKKLNLLT